MLFRSTRVVRITVLSAGIGALQAAVVRGTTPALVGTAVLGFVLGLEVMEPLSQEVDQPDRAAAVPVERGELMVRHLAAPAVALVPFAVIAAVAAWATLGFAADALAPVAILALPTLWAASLGGVVSIVRDAPDPVAASRSTTAIAMPEVTGLGSVVRAALPLVVSTLGAAPVLFVRAASRRGDVLWQSAVRASVGALLLAFMFFGWFSTVIAENEKGMYNLTVDKSFRMGMMWFIMSEVMFFAAFFGALFYARQLSVPWIGGEGVKVFTKLLLWQDYSPAWPTNGPAKIGGHTDGTFETIHAFGLPAINTAILLTSGVTITIAHHALRDG